MATNKILVKKSAYKIQPSGARGLSISISTFTGLHPGAEFYEYYDLRTGIIELIPKELHDAKDKNEGRVLY